ncbi:MAG: ABC transporter permease [Acidobacteriota bacterium]|nr:ABC transporter permease [Acidobacteriota bacterium]
MIQDLKHAFRSLVRTPAFTAVALATLALGIGANTAIFSVVRGVLLRPLPYRDSGRLVVVWEDLIREENHKFSVAEPNFTDLASRATGFEGFAAQIGRVFALTGAGAPESLTGDQVTGNFFALLGARPALGRVILPTDEKEVRRVAVISDGLWKRRFGGAPEVVGRAILLGGEPHVVVGVMPPGFESPAQWKAPQRGAEIWTPLDLPKAWRDRGVAVLQVIGRVKPGVSFPRADQEVRAIGSRLAREYPDTNGNVGMHAVPLATQLVGEVRPALLVLAGAAGFVLLVACANVAHLFLARTLARRREMAIRVALGAGRARLVRPLIAEGLLLAGASAALAFLAVSATTEALVASAPPEIPRLAGIAADVPVLAFAFAAAIAAGLAASLLPALRAASADPEKALRSESVASARASGRFRAGLVVSQVSLALVLFAGAGLLVRTFERLRHFDLGFRPDGVVTARIGLPAVRYGSPEKRLAFFERLFVRLESAPGIAAAGGTTRFPLDPAYGVGSITFDGGSVLGRDKPVVGVRVIGGSYFAAMRIPILKGRGFDGSDRKESEAAGLVNAAMAAKFWRGESPIGKRLAVGSPSDAWIRIVGVVGDVSHDGVDAAPLPELYLPLRQAEQNGLNLVVRGREGAAVSSITAALKREVSAIDPELPLIDVRSMEGRVSDALAQPRFLAEAIGGFALLCLALAAVALFALVSQDGERRRREVGVRMALGAARRDVLFLFVGRTARLVAVGIAAGVAGALLLTRLLRPALHGTPPTDGAAFAAAVAVLAVIGLSAAAAGARRATRVDPLESLRNE